MWEPCGILGGEVANARKNLGAVLITAFVFATAFISLAAYSLVAASPLKIIDSGTPWLTLANLLTNPTFAALLAITLVLGMLGLIIAEFIALSRLFVYMFKFSLNRSYAYISIFFLASCAISLINANKPIVHVSYELDPIGNVLDERIKAFADKIR